MYHIHHTDATLGFDLRLRPPPVPNIEAAPEPFRPRAAYPPACDEEGEHSLPDAAAREKHARQPPRQTGAHRLTAAGGAQRPRAPAQDRHTAHTQRGHAPAGTVPAGCGKHRGDQAGLDQRTTHSQPKESPRVPKAGRSPRQARGSPGASWNRAFRGSPPRSTTEPFIDTPCLGGSSKPAVREPVGTWRARARGRPLRENRSCG